MPRRWHSSNSRWWQQGSWGHWYSSSPLHTGRMGRVESGSRSQTAPPSPPDVPSPVSWVASAPTGRRVSSRESHRGLERWLAQMLSRSRNVQRAPNCSSFAGIEKARCRKGCCLRRAACRREISPAEDQAQHPASPNGGRTHCSLGGRSDGCKNSVAAAFTAAFIAALAAALVCCCVCCCVRFFFHAFQCCIQLQCCVSFSCCAVQCLYAHFYCCTHRLVDRIVNPRRSDRSGSRRTLRKTVTPHLSLHLLSSNIQAVKHLVLRSHVVQFLCQTLVRGCIMC